MTASVRRLPRATIAACADLVAARLADVDIDLTREPYRCPVCRKTTPTLTIDVPDGLRVRVTCSAGCVEAEILRVLDLAEVDLTPASPVGPHAATSRAPRNDDPTVSAALGERLRPGPRPCDIDQEGPELYELLEAYERGELQPVEVVLGQLPDDSPVVAKVAAELRLLIGLRRRVHEDRPLPASARFIARRVGISPRHANRVMQLMCDYGALVACPSLPGREGKRGTRTYAAPNLPPGPAVEVAAANALEALDGRQVGEELVGLDPMVERREQLSVDDAVGVVEAPARSVGMVAASDATDRPLGHAVDGTGGGGGADAQMALSFGPDPAVRAEREHLVDELLRKYDGRAS